MIRQKRPMIRQKRPMIRQKRPMIGQKRPTNTTPGLSDVPGAGAMVPWIHDVHLRVCAFAAHYVDI
jgi:hypothetical protein